jgi:hypothetical protein
VQRSNSDKLRPLTDVNPHSTCACACACLHAHVQLLAYALDVQPLLWRSSPRHEMMHYLILTNCIAILSTTTQSVHGHATIMPRGCLLGHYSCHYVSSRRRSRAQRVEVMAVCMPSCNGNTVAKSHPRHEQFHVSQHLSALPCLCFAVYVALPRTTALIIKPTPLPKPV